MASRALARIQPQGVVLPSGSIMSSPLGTPAAPPSLERLLRPASLALVGASANPQSLGGRTLANLRHWRGTLHLVNPGHAQIDGRLCHPSIASLPEAVDCAVLAVPAAQVEETVRQCAAAGVGAVIIFASGYAETGQAQDRAAQQRLVLLAAQAGMRLVGPNCVGVASHRGRLHAAFAEFPPLTGPADGAACADGSSSSSSDEPDGAASAAPPGQQQRRIALVSQSGAVALALAQAAARAVALSHVLTCGNSADVDVADYVAWLADDPACDAIALAYEGLRDPARLPQALRLAAARGKPVALCKLGSSTAGRAAVRFHTATDPTPDMPADAALPGVVQVGAIERLIETASFLSKAGAAGVPAVAVLSGSGGTGILAVDAAERAGVPTPQPQPATCERLRACLPSFAAARNPCDVTAQATRHPASMVEAARALLADPGFGALVVPWGRSQGAQLLPAYGALARASGKPVCVVWMSQLPHLEFFSAVEQDGALALFFSLDACFAALAAWFAA